MDWTQFFDHYVSLFGITLYWVCMVGLLSLPFCGIVTLMVIVRIWIKDWVQSSKDKAARKKIPRDQYGRMYQMSTAEMKAFDRMIANIKKEDHNGK